MKTQSHPSTEASKTSNATGIKETDHLAGFCDHCGKWYMFIRGIDAETCPICGGKASVKHGTQITTQRTLNVDAKKINTRNVAA